MLADVLDEVRKSFETSPFFSHIGFEIIELNEGKVNLKLSVQEQLLNANQSLHGGVHAAMLDSVMGMAIRSTTTSRCTTININVSFLAPSTNGDHIVATGRILQLGYKIVTAEGEMRDSQGNLLAKAVGTFKLIRD